MSVHMFNAEIGRGTMSVSDLESNINDWVASNAEWVEDTEGHSLTERNTMSGDSWHGATVRFELSDAKDNLLQKFEDKLKNKVDWYRVHYHGCDHDETDRGGCSWQDKAEWTDKDVTIPSYIPDCEVTA